jgi:hypothetical protein
MKIKILLKIIQFLSLFVEDIAIFLGAFFIIRATFLISYVGGLYITGLFLLTFGVLISRKTSKKEVKTK